MPMFLFWGMISTQVNWRYWVGTFNPAAFNTHKKNPLIRVQTKFKRRGCIVQEWYLSGFLVISLISPPTGCLDLVGFKSSPVSWSTSYKTQYRPCKGLGSIYIFFMFLMLTVSTWKVILVFILSFFEFIDKVWIFSENIYHGVTK